MSNMSYCMYRNTLDDLRDCYNDGFDPELEDEKKAAKKLLDLCKKIIAAYDEEEA